MILASGALIAALLAAEPAPSAEALAAAKKALQLEAADPRGALALYEKACALKHHAACAQVALLVASTDATRAFKLAEASCKARAPLGCAVEGIFWLDGVGCTKDDARALGRFEWACEADLLGACGENTTYEYEGPGKAMRFTKDRQAIPGSVNWRVYKTSVPKDRKAIRFTGP